MYTLSTAYLYLLYVILFYRHQILCDNYLLPSLSTEPRDLLPPPSTVCHYLLRSLFNVRQISSSVTIYCASLYTSCFYLLHVELSYFSTVCHYQQLLSINFYYALLSSTVTIYCVSISFHYYLLLPSLSTFRRFFSSVTIYCASFMSTVSVYCLVAVNCS